MQYIFTMFAIFRSCVFGLRWTEHFQSLMLTCNCVCMSNYNAESQSDGLRFNWLGTVKLTPMPFS